MRARHSLPPLPALPRLWLLSDARNDRGLEAALRRLPRGSGFVFRHYHLSAEQRRMRFRALARVAKARGHVVLLAADHRTGRQWGADGSYGGPRSGGAGLHLATAHSMREIAAANRAQAAGVLLSPVFATRSHPGARVLGPVKFRLLAAKATMPVIALGGMNARSTRRLGWPRWAAIDGLSGKADS